MRGEKRNNLCKSNFNSKLRTLSFGLNCYLKKKNKNGNSCLILHYVEYYNNEMK